MTEHEVPESPLYVVYHSGNEGFLHLSVLEGDTKGKHEYMFRGWDECDPPNGEVGNTNTSALVFQTTVINSLWVTKFLTRLLEIDKDMFLVPCKDGEFQFGLAINLQEIIENGE